MCQKQYACIDLKSFYASVECIERNLDPLTTNLVVADVSRTEKTICLAVTPPLKAYGISGRARLFELNQQLKTVNALRRQNAPGKSFVGSSHDALTLRENPGLAVDYIAAVPRMATYIQYSTQTYQIYLKYVAPEDIHVYSIDEVFIDLSPYLPVSGLTAREFVSRMIRDVLDTTGITAAAGIGTNLYLAKIAMDIEAKHVPADERGMRIAELDIFSYRQKLWSHRPLTDFWRIGHGYASRLESHGLYTMGDIARCSASEAGEELLYKMFGINAELLIDHAWGEEPCTIADIKSYKPSANSISSGQVLQCPYNFAQTRLVVQEMTDLLVLDLVEKHLVTDQIVLTVGYDAESMHKDCGYRGEITVDHYGRQIPRHAHGTANLPRRTSSTRLITEAVVDLYDRIVDSRLLIRRINLTACRVTEEHSGYTASFPEQLDLLTDYRTQEPLRAAEENALKKEKSVQKTVLDLKHRYGKNIILKGMNLQKDATARSRNAQIGGHKA